MTPRDLDSPAARHPHPGVIKESSVIKESGVIKESSAAPPATVGSPPVVSLPVVSPPDAIPTPAGPPVSLRRRRIAVSTLFITLGVLGGSWLARTPDVKLRIGLDDDRWGVLGALGSIGAVTAVVLSGVLIKRFGARRLLVTSAPLMLLAAPALATAHSVPHLVLAILAWGLVTSVLQAPMNAAGVELEAAYGRPVMNGLHAGFSLGTLSGALISALAVHAGVSPGAQLAATGVALGCLFAVVLRWLPRPASAIPGPRQTGRTRRTGFVFSLPIALLAGIAFCSVIAESTSSQWSAIYVTQELGAGGTAGALAYACFSGAMAIGRLSGDRLVHVIGRRRFFLVVPWVAAAGIAGVAALGTVAAAFAGFVVVGAGLSCVTPTVYGTAGSLPDHDTGAAVATISLAAWPGFLAGPVIVGALSSATSLRVALLVVAVMAATMTLLAGRMHPPRLSAAA